MNSKTLDTGNLDCPSMSGLSSISSLSSFDGSPSFSSSLLSLEMLKSYSDSEDSMTLDDCKNVSYIILKDRTSTKCMLHIIFYFS